MEAVMAKKEKVQEAQTEQAQDEQVVELTVEQQGIKDALSADDHIAALKELQASDTTSERLGTIIATFLALTNALGADAPATKHALANLESYKPDAAKKQKAPKAPKEPKYNELKDLQAALSAEGKIGALTALSEDTRISSGLSVALTTYLTLVNLDVDQAVKDAALVTLSSFGKSRGSRAQSGDREVFHVQTSNDGKIYTTLCGALEGQGILKTEIVTVGDKQRSAQDIAWRAIRGKLLADGAAEYNGVTYSKVAPSDSAIQSTRTRADKQSSDNETASGDASTEAAE